MNTVVSVPSQNSTHFIEWISLAASHLRLKHGSQARIAIVIDNATWHNKLTKDTIPPKRSWRKSILQRWLINRKISFNLACTKDELLELAFNNLPAKKYLTDVAAAEYQVEIVVRLPIKHCILNQIELCCWQLKGYVRRNNTAFRLDDIIKLSQEYIAALDHCTAFIQHVCKAQLTFRQADNFVDKVIDPDILDSDEEHEDDSTTLSSSDDDF